MQTQIQVMLELQDAMNTRVHPNWRQQGFEWYRAIWVECAELMDHYGWKWWKQQSPDLGQVKLELIDIWHFGLSLLLENNIDAPLLMVELEEAFATEKVGEFRELLEDFTQYTLVEEDFSVPLYVALLQVIGIDFEALYCGYVGKNVLNFFRQDHGYKEGSYRKVWSGREDNEQLLELMEQLDHSDRQFADKLYGLLGDRYRQAVDAKR